jgi:steroid 5-alpha reductase family enzyme
MIFLVNASKAGRKGLVCNQGLWKYCRHPNYFGEWMVWNSHIIISLTSVFNLNIGILGKFLILMNLCLLSYSMWICLTVWTGAEPAEYFSVLKREGYKEYQRSTSMIIPWWPLESQDTKKNEQF